MEFEVFVNIIAEQIREYLTEEWKDAKISVITNDIINCKKTGIVFERFNKRYSPTVYMEEFYEHFKNGRGLEEILEHLGQLLVQLEQDKMQDVEARELLGNTNNIFFDLINTRENEEILKNMPHREFMDLSIVYRCLIICDEKGIATVSIEDSMAAFYELSEQQLYDLAYENTKKLFPIVIKPMEKVVNEILGNEEVDVENRFIVDEAANMHVLSNNIRSYGASVMLYPEEIHKLAEGLGEDLYLLPSSRQEVVAIPKNNEDLYGLAELMYEMNMTNVPVEDRLSHQIYQYNRDTKEITMATSQPYRSLVESKEEPNIEKVEERSTKR